MPEFQPQIHFFICVNDRTASGSTKPSCGPFIDEHKVKEVKAWLRSEGWTGKVYATKTGCLGGCNSQGAVIAVYPEGRFFKGFTSVEEIKSFISEKLANSKI